MDVHRQVNTFCALFEGNRSAVGTEAGGCLRLGVYPDNPGQCDWADRLETHLRHGAESAIGVYPMTASDEGWRVKWGCIDFDEGEEASWAHACNVGQVLAQFSIQAWVERSRSKGYHVWVFLEDWLDPDVVRRGLLAACQVVAAPSKEVNPKQVVLKAGQLGNYVRLPYPGALSGPIYPDPDTGLHHRVMLSPGDGEAYSLRWFLDVAEQTLTTEREMMEVAGLYIPPSYSGGEQRDWSKLEGEPVDRLRGKARIIWEQGPLDSPGSPTNFRGQTLWKLARQIVEDGSHTPEETLDLLRDADRRWGKFSERNDGEQRLQQLVDKAFRGASDSYVYDPGQAKA